MTGVGQKAMLARHWPLAALVIGLMLFYAAPLPLVARLFGLALFGVGALILPLGGLSAALLVVPLYLMPATFHVAGRTILLPLHEVALLLTAGAVGARWAFRRVRSRDLRPAWPAPATARAIGARYAPHLLLVLAGLAGMLLAVPEGRGAALREFRWLIIEPLLFYGLARALDRRMTWLPAVFVGSGALVGLIGALQFLGLDLVPFIGEKRAFSENIVAVDGVRRVTSVYGHPNNLGLFLERVWPLAAALALGIWRGGKLAPGFWLVSFGAILALAGVAVSFSRGAWLASAIAAAFLLVGWMAGRAGGLGRRWVWLLLGGVAIGGVAVLALMVRGGPMGGSTDARVLLWIEALAYLSRHPLGIGLDQFYYYHNPEFGRSLIDPSLLGTSEQFAAHPHNLLLEIWLSLGPLGLAAFAWLIARCYRQADFARRGMRHPALLGALAALSAALVHGLIDRFYFVPDLAFAFWLLYLVVEARPMNDTIAT